MFITMPNVFKLTRGICIAIIAAIGASVGLILENGDTSYKLFTILTLRCNNYLLL